MGLVGSLLRILSIFQGQKGFRENYLMDKIQDRISPFVVGFYAWISAVFFGGILMDILYSNFVKDRIGETEGAAAFSRVADILLLIGFVTIMAAVVAIIVSWKLIIVRNFLIASLCFLSFEFLAPLFLLRFIQNLQELNMDSWLRIIPGGVGSGLAFIGLYKGFR